MKAVDEPARPAAAVLVVEDEPHMQFVLIENLEFAGYSVVAVSDAESAILEMARRSFDVVIVDVMLPRMSGLEFCRDMRARGVRTPIIILTARSEESDRVLGLDLGADDYVTKPFSVRELLARVRAQMRRTRAQPESRDEFAFGDVRVNTRNRLVTRRGHRVEMSNREFDLLRYFLAHRGEVVSREQLLRDVWGYNQVVVTRTVDNFVAKLRCHVEPKPHDPRYLVTVHGSGYQLIV
jgi:two-component system alkaline phosphatase synthesis response regulator PhoP